MKCGWTSSTKPRQRRLHHTGVAVFLGTCSFVFQGLPAFICVPRQPETTGRRAGQTRGVVHPFDLASLGGFLLGTVRSNSAHAEGDASLDAVSRLKDIVDQAANDLESAQAENLGKDFLRQGEQDLFNAREALERLEALVMANEELREVIVNTDVDIFTWMDNHPRIVFGTIFFVLFSTLFYLFQPANPQEVNAAGDTIEYPKNRPPSCVVSHILVKDKALADDILQKLGDSPTAKDFTKFAKDVSICPSGKSKKAPGSLGKLYYNMTDPEVEKVVFNKSNALNVPLGPIKTIRGWHIFWVTSRDEGGDGTPFVLKNARAQAASGDDE